jgi:hypothetical protein
MEAITTVFLGIISGLLTPHARRWLLWSYTPKKITEIDLGVNNLEPPQTPEEMEQIRAQNREKLNAVLKFIFLHGSTFFLLFMAVYMPLGWAILPDGELLFINTRLNWVCSSCTIVSDTQSVFSFTVSGLLYVPAWLISQLISSPVATVLDHFHKVTPNKYMGILMFIFLGVSLLVAGHWVFLIYPKYSYLQSLGIPFIAIFLGGVFVAGNNQRK